MKPEPIRGELVDLGPPSQAMIARAAFLSRYPNPHTQSSYRLSVDLFFEWCRTLMLDPLTGVERGHLEFFARWLEQTRGNSPSTVAQRLNALAGFFKYAFLDGRIPHDPMAHVRRPVVPWESTTNGLSRPEFADVLAAAEAHSERAHALVCLLGLSGLRVSEACGIDAERISFEKGYSVVDIVRKGGRRQIVPLSQMTMWAIDRYQRARGEGSDQGPLLVRRDGQRLDGRTADRVVKRLAKTCGIKRTISPHSFRHTFVTLSLDAGVSERDIQNSTGHKDPRMVHYYDRHRDNLARNATHALTAYVAGAA